MSIFSIKFYESVDFGIRFYRINIINQGHNKNHDDKNQCEDGSFIIHEIVLIERWRADTQATFMDIIYKEEKGKDGEKNKRFFFMNNIHFYDSWTESRGSWIESLKSEGELEKRVLNGFYDNISKEKNSEENVEEMLFENVSCLSFNKFITSQIRKARDEFCKWLYNAELPLGINKYLMAIVASQPPMKIVPPDYNDIYFRQR